MRQPLERELQPELDLARFRDGGCEGGDRVDSRSRGVKNSGRGQPRAGPGKVRPVEQVEELRPELEARGLRQRGVFHQREIEVR